MLVKSAVQRKWKKVSGAHAYNWGASLSEPHVVCSTAEMSVVCLSTYVLKKFSASEKFFCCFNPHTGFNFAFSRRQFGRFDAHNS